MTTKIVALTHALGNLFDFRLLPGQAHDLRGEPELIDTLAADHLLADRAFDADWLRTALSERSITPVIPPEIQPPLSRRVRQGNLQIGGI